MMKTRAAVLRKGGEPEAAEAGPRVRVTISATPQACADCLVPENLMPVSSARRSAYPKMRST